MLCCRRISVIGTPASPCFRMLTIWLSVNRDFRIGISLAPESLPSNCLPGGEAYEPKSARPGHAPGSLSLAPFEGHGLKTLRPAWGREIATALTRRATTGLTASREQAQSPVCFYRTTVR